MKTTFSRHGYLWSPTRRELLKTAGGVLTAGLLAPRIARAATFTLLTHALGVATVDVTIDTTGGTLLLAAQGDYGRDTSIVYDSYGNTWTPLIQQGGASVVCTRLFYCKNPTVGAGHHITFGEPGGFPVVWFAAFSGANITAPFDQQNGAVLSTTPGSILPTKTNELVVSAVGLYLAAGLTWSVDASMTIIDSDNGAFGDHSAFAVALKIQTSAAAINPVWNQICDGNTIASFLSTSSTDPSSKIRHRASQG
jgi:hypothetical protein